MTIKIAIFNHKGGVSKTTTTFNLGWMLASKGHRVIIVDTDPQCNLTGLVLGYKSKDEFERFYTNEAGRNLRDGLSPAFESRPRLLEAVDCLPVEGQEGLFLLPGHIRMSEYEVTLTIAQQLSGSIQTLQNIPGSISYILEKTAAKFEADYILIDMSPSLSSINQNLFMTSDFFIIPTNPSYFSVMAVDSLATFLPKWYVWAEKAHSLQILQNAVYPFPQTTPKFLGVIIQRYQLYSKKPTASFQKWVDDIEKTISDKLVPSLKRIGMMLPEQAYTNQNIDGYNLASIPDFQSLIAKAQTEQTPVFALSQEQLGQAGAVENISIKRRDKFKQIFSELAEKVIGLTNPSDKAIIEQTEFDKVPMVALV